MRCLRGRGTGAGAGGRLQQDGRRFNSAVSSLGRHAGRRGSSRNPSRQS